jgi:hypothetical protein
MAWARGGTSRSNQLFDRQAVGQVVADGVHVIQAVGHHLGLLVGLGFHVLLDAGVQEADIGDAVDDDSPSSSSSRRSTPCVLGCCGPIFNSMVSPVDRAARDQVSNHQLLLLVAGP